MSLFVAGLGHASSKESRAAMVIGDMDISRLMVLCATNRRGEMEGMRRLLKQKIKD